MLMGYAIPAMTFSISGTGASFVTDASKLGKLRPADATRLQWLSTGSPVITDTVTITAQFGSSISARCAALLMPNLSTALPAGVKVTISGKLSGSGVVLAGNATTLRTYTLPSGATAAHWVFPATTIDTLVITIYNDRNGATWAAASQYFLLGAIVAGKGADFAIANDLSTGYGGGLLQRQSHNNQAWALQTQPWRTFTPNFVPMDETHVLGPLTYQDDFETVAYSFNTSKASIIIPAYLNGGDSQSNVTSAPVVTTATINQQRLARYFMLGVPSQPISWKRNGDNYSIGTFTMSELPP